MIPTLCSAKKSILASTKHLYRRLCWMNFLVLLCCHGCCLTVDRQYYFIERTKVYDALGHRRGQQGLLLCKKKALEIQEDGLLLCGALNRKSLTSHITSMNTLLTLMNTPPKSMNDITVLFLVVV